MRPTTREKILPRWRAKELLKCVYKDIISTLNVLLFFLQSKETHSSVMNVNRKQSLLLGLISPLLSLSFAFPTLPLLFILNNDDKESLT